MGTYLKDKEVIQVYLTGFKCMLQLINCAGAVDKLKIEELHRLSLIHIFFGLRDSLEQDAFMECVAGLEKVYED